MNGLLMAGDVFIDRQQSDGSWAGYQGPINVTKLELKPESEKKTRPSKKKANYGQALDTVYIPKPSAMTLEFDDQSADLLAIALLGDVKDINEGSGTVADEALVLPADNRWVEVGKKNLATAGIGAKLASDDSAIDLADIEINYAAGLVRAAPGGSLGTTETNIKFSFQHNAISGKQVSAGTNTVVKLRIKFDGINLANNKPIDGLIPLATAAPSSAIDLVSGDFISSALQGEANIAPGYEEPFILNTSE